MSVVSHPNEFPRELSVREAEILDYMLGVDDVRVEPLRTQRGSVVATGRCTCGCATIDLAVDRDRSEPAALCGQPISANLSKTKAALADPNEFYGLLVFLDEGWLSSLEIWWIQKPPPEFPPATAFDPPAVTCERREAQFAAQRRHPPIWSMAGVRRLFGRRSVE